MRRYLVVANQTLCGEHLIDRARALASQEECAFFVLVPATHPSDHATWTEGEAEALARRRLRQALARFAEEGLTADGTVGDASPVLAIDDVLRHRAFDAIVLSTLPPGPSRWLRQDLPHRVERRFGLPVEHLVAVYEPV